MCQPSDHPLGKYQPRPTKFRMSGFGSALALALPLLTLLACGGGGGHLFEPQASSTAQLRLTGVRTLKDDIFWPGGIVTDSEGTLFVAGNTSNCIYRVTPDGTRSVLAGSEANESGTDDGNGTDARFLQPMGMAIDAANNLYVCDCGNARIRKITPAGAVTTLAGTTPGYKDGAGSVAQFNAPVAIAIDRGGTLYVADTKNRRVRTVSSSGVVGTLAGSGVDGRADGKGNAASFGWLFGIAVNQEGTVYVSDSVAHQIRKITHDGVVSTLAGSPDAKGEVDGTGTAARFSAPCMLTLDPAGNLYVPDSDGSTIRKVTPAGVVTTIAGTAGRAGHLDGAIGFALLRTPQSVCVSGTKVYVGEYQGSGLRVMDEREPVVPAPTSVNTLAAMKSPSEPSLLSGVSGVVSDEDGNTYVALTYRNCIYKITPEGTATLLAGAEDGSSGNVNAVGNAARFNYPAGLAYIPRNSIHMGALCVSDLNNNAIRLVWLDGDVRTLAGTGVSGYKDGGGDVAQFNHPTGLALDPTGDVLTNTLFVADTNNFRIRKVDFDFVFGGVLVSTVAGSGTPSNVDGTGTAAGFAFPHGIAVDGPGTIYVSDWSHVIRRITQAGVVTTFAGSTNAGSEADGKGTEARFNRPGYLSLDGAGNLYVPDMLGRTIRKVTPAGVVTTVAGKPGQEGSTNGPLASALFDTPEGVCVDGARIVVTDSGAGVDQYSTGTVRNLQ